MNFEDCLERGLIKKNLLAKERIKNSIKLAERFLIGAKRNYKIDEYEIAELAAYNSIFHSMRALLFNKGYIERSHHCLFVAIRALYKDNKEIVEKCSLADRIRSSRHNIQYGGKLVNKEEVKFVLNCAEEILKIVKKHI